MSFDPNARLDPSQIEDVRGRRGSGGGAGMGRVIGAGGGGLGVLVILAYILLNGLAGGSTTDSGTLGTLLDEVVGGDTTGAVPQSSALAACKTGADANAREDCRIVGYVNSIQSYWTTQLKASKQTYQPAYTRFFSGSYSTGCGTATSSSGPFYCPTDGRVYIDLGFFDELHSKYGASAGPLAQAYVLAHEYGHHVQDLLGVLDQNTSQSGATGQSVRTELQADCYAGVWAGNAVKTGYLLPITDAQIADALNAAAAVGDDRIQSKVTGRVDPESWTHGSSARRQKWFLAGYNAKSPSACDTFSGAL